MTSAGYIATICEMTMDFGDTSRSVTARIPHTGAQVGQLTPTSRSSIDFLGNAWAAAGMVRVLETIRYSGQSSQLVEQQANLTAWVQEIVDAVWPLQVRRVADSADAYL